MNLWNSLVSNYKVFFFIFVVCSIRLLITLQAIYFIFLSIFFVVIFFYWLSLSSSWSLFSKTDDILQV